MVDFSGEGSVSVSGRSAQGFLGIIYATVKGIDLKRLTN